MDAKRPRLEPDQEPRSPPDSESSDDEGHEVARAHLLAVCLGLEAAGDALHETQAENAENAYLTLLRFARRGDSECFAHCWFSLGQLQQYQLGDYDAALHSYNAAVAHHNTDALMGLAHLISDHFHDHRAAIQYLSVAVHIPEHSIEARLSMALLLDVTCCRYIDAARIYRQFVSCLPSSML